MNFGAHSLLHLQTPAQHVRSKLTAMAACQHVPFTHTYQALVQLPLRTAAFLASSFDVIDQTSSASSGQQVSKYLALGHAPCVWMDQSADQSINQLIEAWTDRSID